MNWTLTYTPRNWQEEALALWRKDLHGVVSIVTGGGKTIFAFLCMLAFRQRYPAGRYVIIVPTTALLDQWYVALQEVLHVPAADIACYSGQEKPRGSSVINLLVINSARELAPRLSHESPSCLIVDECHHAGSPQNALALRGSYVAALGLSATPEREYDAGFEERVVPVVGNIIYDYDYNQARRDGVIVPFELVNARISLLPDEQRQYDRLTKQIAILHSRVGSDAGAEIRLTRALQQRFAVTATATMRIPAAVRLVEQHRLDRSLVFHERVDAATKISNNLHARNHRAALYHTGLGPALRRDNLRLFRSGVFDVLVTCRALDEGVNIPETRIAVIASSTSSQRQRIQRLGRILRPAEGKESARIYTVYATEQEERRLIDEAKSLNDVASVEWLRITRE